MHRHSALLTLCLVFFGHKMTAHAQVQQLAPPLGLGSQDKLIVSDPHSGPTGGHFRLQVTFPTTDLSEGFAGHVGLSFSLFRFVEAGAVLSAQLLAGDVLFRQGPVLLWARVTPVGRVDGFALGAEVQYAVGRGPFDGGGQLVPDLETFNLLTGWRKSILDLSLQVGYQMADHGNYIGGQAGAGAWVTLWKKQGLQVGGEAVGRLGDAAGETRTAWLASFGLRLYDEYGVQATGAYAIGDVPGAHTHGITASLGTSFGPGYKRPEPAPRYQSPTPALDAWWWQLLHPPQAPPPGVRPPVLLQPELPGAACRVDAIQTWLPCQVRAWRSEAVGRYVERTLDLTLQGPQSPPIYPPAVVAVPLPQLHPPGVAQVPGMRPPVLEPYPPSVLRPPGRVNRSGGFTIWEPPTLPPRQPVTTSTGRPQEPAPEYDPIPQRPPADPEAAARALREELEGGAQSARQTPQPAPAPQQQQVNSAQTPTPRGSNHPNTAAASRRGMDLHKTKLPEEFQAKHPETEVEFTPPGHKGQDIHIKGGKHPSEYPGSTWPKGVNHGDFKPDTPGGHKTFRHDQKTKWPEPTHMVPYDPATGKLR